MRFDLIPKTRAKIEKVDVQSKKLGQTELRPAVCLHLKATLPNTVLNQFSPTLRAFLFEKSGAATAQGTLDGVEVVSDLPALTPEAQRIGTISWDDEQTGTKLLVYQGVTGDMDIRLADGTVSKVQFICHDGGTVDVFFRYYVDDVDADTLGMLAVLLNHELDIELVPPAPKAELPEVEQASGEPTNPLEAMKNGTPVDPEAGAGEAPAGGWPFPTSASDKPEVQITTKRSRKAAAQA